MPISKQQLRQMRLASRPKVSRKVIRKRQVQHARSSQTTPSEPQDAAVSTLSAHEQSTVPVAQTITVPSTRVYNNTEFLEQLQADGWRPATDFPHGPQIGMRRQTRYGTSVPMFAILSTWHEADIVEAAVYNCFAQGFDRVFLVDNDSPDDTIACALRAGAELACTFHTEFYQEGVRLREINQVIRRITADVALPVLWWGCFDADELPYFPGGNIRMFVEQLPVVYNVIGAVSIDHYPTAPLANIRGFHPAEFQPCGMYRTTQGSCNYSHWKHPMICTRNGRATVGVSIGIHCPIVHSTHPPLVEPDEMLLLHHCPFRNRADTETRLAMLCAPKAELGGNHRSITDDKAINAEGAIKRWRNLAAIYEGRFQDAELPHAQAWRGVRGIPVQPLTELLSPEQLTFARWYTEAALQRAIAAHMQDVARPIQETI